MAALYMLDTNTCSFIMRESPVSVLVRLDEHVGQGDSIVISAVTYAELRFGAIGKKASPKHMAMVDGFVRRLDGILPWGTDAVDHTVQVRLLLAARGTPIGNNDSAIAGHALSERAILVTNNRREFDRVPDLSVEDWTSQ